MSTTALTWRQLCSIEENSQRLVVSEMTEVQAHDPVLLAKLAAFPRRNKANFAFGKFLLAEKFYDEHTRVVVQEEALAWLAADAKRIASRFKWRHPEGDGGWKTLAWDTVTQRAAKYAHLTEVEIFAYIQNKKFWAWRWLYEAMITLFRQLQSERNQASKYYFAARPDKRRRGLPLPEDDYVVQLQTRTEDTPHSTYAIRTTAYIDDLGDDLAFELGFDTRANPSPDKRMTKFELKFDANPQGECEAGEEAPAHTSLRVADESPVESPCHTTAQRWRVVENVDPHMLSFMDRLVRDKSFGSSVLGIELADFDPNKLHKLSTLVLRRYAQQYGLSQRTAERRVKKIRGVAAQDQRLLSRFGVSRR